MPPVVAPLEQHEPAARRRVDGLRKKADRIQAELAAAERGWQQWAIARRRVDTVLAPGGGNTFEAGAERRSLRNGRHVTGGAVVSRFLCPATPRGEVRTEHG